MSSSSLAARASSSGLGKRLARGAAASFAMKLGGTMFAFGLQLMLADWLGKAGFGIYATALTWANVAVLAAKGGLDTASLRYLPEYERDPVRQASYMRWSQRRGLLAGLTLGFLGALILMTLPGIPEAFRQALFVACLAVPVLASLQISSSHLLAKRRVSASQGPLLALVPGLALVIVALTSRFELLPSKPFLGLALYTGAALLSLGVSLNYRRDLFTQQATLPSKKAAREWSSLGRSLVLTAGFGLILAQADLLMLGPLAGAEAAGEYAAATRLARFLSFPLMAANAVLAPLISQRYHDGALQELEGLLQRAVRWIALASAPLLIALGWGAPWLLGLFGQDFTAATPVLWTLLIGHIVNVAAGPVGYLLNLTGSHQLTARILGSCAVLNLVLNGILIPQYGTSGAAVATATTTVAWNLSMYLAVRRRLGIRPSGF